MKSFEDYQRIHKESISDPEQFWARQAEGFIWRKPWTRVKNCDFSSPDIKWFENAKLNITENCLDRHAATDGDKIAIIWEPNDPNATTRKISYRELLDEVCKCANALKANGIRKGDRIVLYMPMVPELAIAVLACARIGAVHSVVFAGFSAQALSDRINDAEAKMVICSDYNFRGSKVISVKKIVDEAILKNTPSIENVLVHKNSEIEVDWNSSIDKWWHEELQSQSTDCPPEIMDAEDLLFILYTSGSTGKPKGVVHTTAGYMVYTHYTFKTVFQYQEGDVYWCTADIGWITGHSYIIYGPLLAGGTSLMFEGIPTFPDPSRFWQICEKHSVNQFYTAPTAIRALMAKGNHWTENHDLSSIKVLGSVGEPINLEAWNWYNEKIGKKKATIIDTWFQTETGGIMITPIPGITDTKPCFASYPIPGIETILVDQEGNTLEGNDVEGLLCINQAWPAMLRSIYGDHPRCKQTYFSMFEGKYFTGDGARRDKDGRIRVIGRVDDVLNVSGHRMGTAEVENAINEHPKVVESAVVGYPHEIKGQGIFAYVIADGQSLSDSSLTTEIKDVVTKEIGPIAKPDLILIVTGLPKTRSGKIMRRILRKIACKEEDQLGDISTLLNPEVVNQLIELRKRM